MLGLIVAFVLNEGLTETLYVFMQNSHEYGLSIGSIAVTTVLFGFVAPVISILGPTEEAMGKNLRASLDASRRNGANEGVSAAVKKLQDLGLSRQEVALSIFLILFGFLTYYLIPLALLFENFGIFFFTMNLILTGLSAGIVLLAVVSMPYIQEWILKAMLCCRRKDRLLTPIILNRLESGRSKN